MRTARLETMDRIDHRSEQAEQRRAKEEFTDFYRRELAGQVRRAKLLTGSNEAAADLVHDAFTAVFRRWDTLDDPGPYVTRTVINACRDAARHTSTAVRVHRRLEASHGDAPDDVLWDVLATLPFNQRACVVLRYYAGMNEREIADTLHCKPGSVGPWTTRALKTMRKAL